MNVPPEQQRAKLILQESIENWKEKIIDVQQDGSILDTNFIGFSVKQIHLPPQQHWTWNLSCGKTTWELKYNNEQLYVLMYKMNSRKKRGVKTIPSYKVWVYEISKYGKPPHIHGIWCEKGTTDRLEGKLHIDSLNDLELRDFSFLKPFVANELADEFGWTN